jgi:hypothetical protein
MFKRGNPLNFYIHGAFWHDNFGQPMSGGCVNVAYENMEPLYNWADEQTKLIITQDGIDSQILAFGLHSKYEVPRLDLSHKF